MQRNDEAGFVAGIQGLLGRRLDDMALVDVIAMGEPHHLHVAVAVLIVLPVDPDLFLAQLLATKTPARTEVASARKRIPCRHTGSRTSPFLAPVLAKPVPGFLVGIDPLDPGIIMLAERSLALDPQTGWSASA